MEYKSKYKAEEIEAILDAKNNTGEAVDKSLDGLFVDALQTKEVELSESAEITPDEGFLGLKKVNVTVKGGANKEGLKFYDVSSLMASGPSIKWAPILQSGMMVKVSLPEIDTVMVFPALGMLELGVDYVKNITAIATDPTQRVISITTGDMKIADILSEVAGDITEITEEQFYTI